MRIEIPPLRERRDDIPLLVHHFLRKHAGSACRIEGIEDEALELLVEADWPGNVRELENAIESAMALARGPRLRAADLPRARRGGERGPGAARRAALAGGLRALALERALRRDRRRRARAARLLGLGRSTLYRKLSKHALAPRRGAARSARWGRVSAPPERRIRDCGRARRARRKGLPRAVTTPAPRWLLLAQPGRPASALARTLARAEGTLHVVNVDDESLALARCREAGVELVIVDLEPGRGARALARAAAARGPARAGRGGAGRGRAAAAARARPLRATTSSRT